MENIKALIKTSEKNILDYRNVEIPTLKKDEILVKVNFCGICGSDLHAANLAKGYEFIPDEIILGHELSGVVESTYHSENDELLGEKVVIIPSVYCEECENCNSGKKYICENLIGLGLHYNGGMAEYVKVKKNQIILLDRKLSLDVMSLTEPMSVAMHAIKKLKDQIYQRNILVQGCGIIGMFTAILAKEYGAKVTISGLKKDEENRLKKATLFSIDYKIADNLNTAREYDFIFECSGSNLAFETSFDLIKKGGALVIVGLYEREVSFPINIAVRYEIDILSSYSSNIKAFAESINILNKYEDSMKNLISIFNLENGQEAFNKANNQEVLKPVLKIN